MVADSTPDRKPDRPPLAALVEQAAGGDRDAARALFREVGPIFLAAARRTLGRDHPDIDDFVQDASLRFFASLHAFRGEARVRRYAYRIGVHVAADWVRAKTALKRDRVKGEIPEHAAAEGSPVDPLHRRELLQLLERCLSPIQLETFLLRNIMGCTLDEIAAATDAPTNTVRSRLRLARANLQHELARKPELMNLLEGTDG